MRVAVWCCGGIAVLTGVTALVGWWVDSDALKGGLIGHITIKANTAACLVLAGLALVLLARDRRSALETILGRVFAGTLVVVGLATLAEHLFTWDLGIDQVLFREVPGVAATTSPNRMGPPASSCFPLLGAALLLLDWRRHAGARIQAPFQIPTLVVMSVALLSLIGYLFNVRELFGIAQITGIAFLTSFGFLVLGLGALFARPHAGFMRRIVARDPGGLVIRRMLPAAIVLPILISWLRSLGEGAGWYTPEFGRSLTMLLFIAVFAGLTWWTGGTIARNAAQLGEARAAMLAEIHDRKVAQEALREADRRKDEFLATLAHELRNPLAPIRTAVEVLKVRGGLDPEAEWSRAIIERQVGSLARLLDDLLDVSRITRDRLELRREPTPIGTIVRLGLEASRPLIDAAHHEITVALPEPEVWVAADPVRIAQVISNLLNNAAKYTAPGGHLALTARREDDDLVVAVRDDGVGIPPGRIAHVFDMFVQGAPAAQGTLAAEGARSGLGIGLAISRAIVEAHGGSLEAKSAGEGRGSEFVFRLPAVAAPEQAVGHVPSRRIPRAASPIRVLVADDNEDALESLAMMLELLGHQALRAHDGVEAVETFEREHPAVALLDIGMPRMNGLEVARRIRAQPASSGVRLVALTGWGQPEDRARAREAGFDHHLVKPVELTELAPLLQPLS